MKARILSASAFGLAVLAAASYPAYAQDIILEDGMVNAPCSATQQAAGPCNNNPQPKELQGPNIPSNGLNAPTTTGSISNANGVRPDMPAVTTGNGSTGNGAAGNGSAGNGSGGTGLRSGGAGGMGGTGGMGGGSN